MDQQALEILDLVWPYFRSGFYAVNTPPGLVVAAACALLMGSLWRLPVFSAGASLAFLLLGALPVFLQGAAPTLPPIVELGFWQRLLQIFAGYLLVIPLFYLFKVLVLRLFAGGADHGEDAHGGHDKGHHGDGSAPKGKAKAKEHH